MTAVHDHPHRHESHAHVHGGPPVLDIGGDIGAMLALMDDDQVGTELFLRNVADSVETHTGVWHRTVGDGVVTAAVFLELIEGTYEVLGAPGHGCAPVAVEGGRLTELDLQTSG